MADSIPRIATDPIRLFWLMEWLCIVSVCSQIAAVSVGLVSHISQKEKATTANQASVFNFVI